MNPFTLLIELLLETHRLRATWYGQSALTPVDTQEFALAPDALPGLLPATFTIDLAPLLEEVGNGAIPDEATLAASDDLLPLRDLLAPADFTTLSETLYDFLWQEAQADLDFSPIKGEPEKAWSDPDQRLVRVWFATNRKPLDQVNIARGFATEESADGLTYGLCHVFIPESHKPGSVGTPWWRRWIRFQADDHLEVRAIEGLAADRFWHDLAGKLESWWQPGERNLFVLIHGFNVGFNEAAIRAAQIGYDLKVPGEMAVFSWPSHGETTDYFADEANIGASYPYIAQFLRELSEKSGAERIHIFAHSMGNRGMIAALERLVTDGVPNLQLGQVFFCAPDEDVRIFKDKVTRYPHRSENRTLLVSPEDKAVALSKWVHQHNRVGIAPPITVVDGIDTITVSGFGLLDMGHGYFASAAPVIEDLREAILTGKKAHERQIPQPTSNYFTIDI
ncbi:MAG: alpha/beta hydrolase [Caldilineaceae bacterium]